MNSKAMNKYPNVRAFVPALVLSLITIAKTGYIQPALLYTYICTYINTYIHTYIHTYVHTCIHTFTCMHTHIQP